MTSPCRRLSNSCRPNGTPLGIWSDDGAQALLLHVQPDTVPQGKGSGYVVDSLHSAYWMMQVGGYEQVVKAAIALGRDTDTTACIAGGIAGLRDGVAAIPQRWHEALRGKEIVQPLLEKLLATIPA